MQLAFTFVAGLTPHAGPADASTPIGRIDQTGYLVQYSNSRDKTFIAFEWFKIRIEHTDSYHIIMLPLSRQTWPLQPLISVKKTPVAVTANNRNQTEFNQLETWRHSAGRTRL
jgi:hypothetical protein